jgi:3-oxoacyl-[acyl-carrier-protein] synthase-1
MQLAMSQRRRPHHRLPQPARHLDPGGRRQGDGAVRAVFGDKVPAISSTKSLTGHSLGAAGAQEAIYCLLMMQHGFLAESAHIDNLDPEFEGLPILRARKDRRSRR